MCNYIYYQHINIKSVYISTALISNFLNTLFHQVYLNDSSTYVSAS